MRRALVLNDGRTFTNYSGATISGYSYLSSPFEYSVKFFCLLASTVDFNGNYKATADAWADYALGDIDPVIYNPTFDTLKLKISHTRNPYP